MAVTKDEENSIAPSAKQPRLAGVYVLCLRNGNAYVGQTEDMKTRIQDHEESPNRWTIQGGGFEKPVEQPWVQPLMNLSDWERQETLLRMLVEGHNSVRGWEFIACEKLSYSTRKESICKNITGALTCLCRKCGYLNHTANTCVHSERRAPWKNRILHDGDVTPCVQDQIKAKLSPGCGTFPEVLKLILETEEEHERNLMGAPCNHNNVFVREASTEVAPGTWKISSPSGSTALLVCTTPIRSASNARSFLDHTKGKTKMFVVTIRSELCDGANGEDAFRAVVVRFEDDAQWIPVVLRNQEMILLHIEGCSENGPQREDHVYCLQMSHIRSCSALLCNAVKPARIIELVKQDKLSDWCRATANDMNITSTLGVFQRGAGNGKTFESIQWLTDPTLEHKRLFIYLTKQHTAKSQVLKELKEQQSSGKIKLDEISTNIVEGRDVKQFRLEYQDRRDRVLCVIIATLDSFMFAMGTASPGARNYFEGIARAIACHGAAKMTSEGMLRWNGEWSRISPSTLIILDEAQDNQITYLHALERVQASTGVEVRVIGDRLQSLQHKENIMTHLANEMSADSRNVVRRFHNPALMRFVNDTVHFAKFNLPSIADICPGCDCKCFPHVDRQPEALFLPPPMATAQERNDAEASFIANCLRLVEKEIHAGSHVLLPEDFMFLFPILKNQSLPQRLCAELQRYWKSKFEDETYCHEAAKRDSFWSTNVDDAWGHDYVVVHMSEEGTAIRLEESDRATRLMSIHAAKGTGRRIVFALNMTEANLRKFESEGAGTLHRAPNDLVYESLWHVAVTRPEVMLYVGILDNGDDICRRIEKAIKTGVCQSGLDNNMHPSTVKVEKAKLVRDVANYAWNGDTYHDICELGGINTQSRQNLPETDAQGSVDYAHHCIRRCVMHYTIMTAIIQEEMVDNPRDQMRTKLGKLGTMLPPEWFEDPSMYYKRWYKRSKKEENKKLPLPLLEFRNSEKSQNDWGKYKPFLQNLVTDVMEKVRCHPLNVPPLCPIETIVLYHLLEAYDCRMDFCNIMQVYNVLRAYTRCGVEKVRDSHMSVVRPGTKSSCCCVRHISGTILRAACADLPDRNGSQSIAVDIAKHYEVTSQLQEKYVAFKEDLRKIAGPGDTTEIGYNVFQTLIIDSPSPEFQVSENFDILAYHEKFVVVVALKPQYNQLNSQETCFESLFRAFLVHHSSDKLEKRYCNKPVYGCIWTLNCEKPFFISYDFSEPRLRSLLLQSVRDAMIFKYEKYHGQLYRAWKYFNTNRAQGSAEIKKDGTAILGEKIKNDNFDWAPPYWHRLTDILRDDKKVWKRRINDGTDETAFLDLAQTLLEAAAERYTNWGESDSSSDDELT